MRLASYTVAGRSSYGIVTDNGAIDLPARLGPDCPTLRSAIAAGALPRIRAAATAAPDVPLAALRYDLPIPDSGKIVCIGRNYRGHVAEGNLKLPEQPSVFIRALESFVPEGGALVRPRVSTNFDYEGELAVVIGTPGRHIAPADALSHVFGYTCLNEGSIRDYQFTHSLTVGKNFHRSGSIGPWIVPAADVGDPTRLTLRTILNGAEVQHTLTDDLIFDIPTIIAYLSVLLPLNPGDIISTGTPEGVGFARKPPLWLKAGDVVEVEISGIGTLRNGVVDET
jgi:2-keto-4-pentenoate hydratase/2-oxohepta-3-ene-1,7-dioic acid hydratase in catechol pathway